MIPGGMSDLAIPEEDPPPRDCDCSSRAACYCYDNGHTGKETCIVCGENLSPVRPCDACGQTYVISHLGDTGICRMCEVAEQGLRNMIADEVRLIMDDYQTAVLNQIRQAMEVKSRRDV